MPAEIPLDLPIYFEGSSVPNDPEGGARIGSALTDTLGFPLDATLDHCPAGLERLLHQFKGKPRLEAFICVFLDQVQLAENAFWDLFILRTLDQSEGAQLNGLGRIVGEARQDRTDSVFRRFIRVRILVNRSSGKLEELYGIVSAALDGAVARIQEHYPASEIVHVDSTLGDLPPESLYRILFQAKAGGVKLFLISSYSEEAATFIWDTDPPGTDNGTGWGSTTNGTWGGDWASIIG
jgi:hypothetical protein